MEACHFSLQPVRLLKEINVSSRIIKIIRYFQLAPYTLPVTPASPLSFVFDRIPRDYVWRNQCLRDYLWNGGIYEFEGSEETL